MLGLDLHWWETAMLVSLSAAAAAAIAVGLATTAVVMLTRQENIEALLNFKWVVGHEG